jgi:hypothetical protein
MLYKKIINNKFEVRTDDEIIYRYTVLPKCSLDMETVKLAEKTGDEWCRERRCANLIDIRNLIFIDSESRNYAAKIYRPHVKAVAVIVGARTSSFFGNLYLTFSKPKMPTRLFTDQLEAENWLKEQLESKN